MSNAVAFAQADIFATDVRVAVPRSSEWRSFFRRGETYKTNGSIVSTHWATPGKEPPNKFSTPCRIASFQMHLMIKTLEPA